MRDEIRQILHEHHSRLEDGIFECPPELANEPLHILISSAIGGMDAYSRIKNSSSRNMTTDVFNLTREFRKKYFVEQRAAAAIIECIAELLGYTSPGEAQPPPVILSPAVGDTVQFGDYDWRVLDVQGGMALLLSRDITEQRAYHPCYAGVTWENSTLREYLNSDFLNNFDAADRDRIVEARISNPGNLWYGTSGGNDTADKIFILSLEEADRYFGDSGDYINKRRKKYDNGKWVYDENGWIFSNEYDADRAAGHRGLASFWWLRSPGYSDCTVAYVSTTGNILPNGDRVCIGRGGVRPALWIRL